MAEVNVLEDSERGAESAARMAQPAGAIRRWEARHNFWLNETRQNEIQGGPPLQGRLNPYSQLGDELGDPEVC